jgi:PAS domain S-box-containing protein
MIDNGGPRLAAQHALARELLQGEHLEDVAPTFISSVARLLNWDAGAIWEVTAPEEPLRFVSSWQERSQDLEDLWKMSRELRFMPGFGLPGRAWASGEISWIPALEADQNFPRLAVAKRLGLAAGLAIPVPVGSAGSVLAISEFFTSSFERPDDALIDLLSGFSAQLAAFITRTRAEASVREQDALKSAMLASALDPIVWMDHRGRIAEFNQAAEGTFGYSRDEAMGRQLAELLIPPELRERHYDGLRRYLQTGVGEILDRRVELTAQRRGGGRLPVELAVTRIPGSDPPLFTGFIRDVSDRQQAEQTRTRLAAVVESTADAVYAKDLEARIISWNPGAEKIYGYPAPDAIGRHVSILVPEDHLHEEMRILDRIKRGERIETYETERIRRDGVRIAVSLTVSPIETPVLGIVGASVVARDITAAKRHRDAQEFLANASSELDTSLDPIATARSIVETAVPDLAELCVIDLLRSDGLLGDSVAAAADPALARELEGIRSRAPLDPSGDHPVAQTLRARHPMVFRDLTNAGTIAEVAQSNEHLEFIHRAGYRSAAVVPMVARGRGLGALSFLHVQSDRRYDESELELLADLGARAAIVLDNASLYAERDRVARTLQRGLRPERPPVIPGVETSIVFEAAGRGIEVGGDFYDIFETPDGWLVLIGDVAGKGSEAATFTAQIRHSIRALVLGPWRPDEVFQRVNELLLRGGIGDRFASALLGKLVIEGDELRIELSGAGHPPAVRLSEEGPKFLGKGALLGVWEDPFFGLDTARMAPGGTLVLYTDGLLEAGDVSDHISFERLAQRLAAQPGRPLEELTRELRADALRRSEGQLQDDLVVVALRSKLPAGVEPNPAGATPASSRA